MLVLVCRPATSQAEGARPAMPGACWPASQCITCCTMRAGMWRPTSAAKRLVKGRGQGNAARERRADVGLGVQQPHDLGADGNAQVAQQVQVARGRREAGVVGHARAVPRTLDVAQDLEQRGQRGACAAMHVIIARGRVLPGRRPVPGTVHSIQVLERASCTGPSRTAAGLGRVPTVSGWQRRAPQRWPCCTHEAAAERQPRPSGTQAPGH